LNSNTFFPSLSTYKVDLSCLNKDTDWRDQINIHIHTYIHAGIRVKKKEKAFENDKKKKGNQDSMIHVIKLSCLISSQIVVIQSD